MPTDLLGIFRITRFWRPNKGDPIAGLIGTFVSKHCPSFQKPLSDL